MTAAVPAETGLTPSVWRRLTSSVRSRKSPTPHPDRAPPPKQLVLDWTDYCNAKCFFCPRESYEKEIGGKGGFIPLEKLRKLERVLKTLKYFTISSGIGEPLLHPELEQILGWIYRINPSILLRTVTNGTALTAEKASWFAGHLDWLSVSLNAANGEAHMRDMFPHLAIRGIEAEKRWQLHLRHIREFVAALPPEDRLRVRFQMVTHRHNVSDVVDFVRLVKTLGASQAVITNMVAHPHTVDRSLFWVKDQYNDLVEEACDVGARIGVQVHTARFYTSVRPSDFDLDKVCRDPIETAYVSLSHPGKPCCHWLDEPIPLDVYNNENGFEEYWNNDTLRRLRQKRSFRSCDTCGMSKVFDQTSFHFSWTLKQKLVAEGRLSEADGTSDYPDADLVKFCVENRLDLPSIRRTLLRLKLPVDMVDLIAKDGLSALSIIDDACWKAFQKTNDPSSASVNLSYPILGIGWGPCIYEWHNKVASRWISAARVASLFLRVTPGAEYEIRLTAHLGRLTDLQNSTIVRVNGRPIDMKIYEDGVGRPILRGVCTVDQTRDYEGRLWLKIEAPGPAGPLSFMRVALGETEPLRQEDALIRQQEVLFEKKKWTVNSVYDPRSWRAAAPLRKLRAWLRS